MDYVFPGTAIGVTLYYNKTDETVNIQRFCFMARANTDSVFERCQAEQRYLGSGGISEPLSYNIGGI